MIIKSKHYFLPAIFLSSLIIGIFLFTKQRQPIFPQALCKDCNVILITMTNLRYDHMSSNGYFRTTTPNLDKLAKESIVFDNAFSHESWTLPESITLYTSRYPYQHGIMGRYDGSQLPEDDITFIDILNKRGYGTAAFTGGFDYSPDYGVTNRFLKYEECSEELRREDGKLVGFRSRMGSKLYGGFSCTVPKALEWIKNSAGGKFFLHIQGYDAHCPFTHEGGQMYNSKYLGTVDFSECLWTYDRADTIVKDGKAYYEVFSAKGTLEKKVLLSEDDIEQLVALYDESITIADREIGKLMDILKTLDLYDKTIIVFTSEHGDMFGKHGRFMRGGPRRGTFYDDVMHVPLIIRHPNVFPSSTKGLVGHIDLAPTLLSFLDIDPKEYKFMQGENLSPLIFEGREVNSEIFAGAEFNPNPTSIYFSKRTRIESIRTQEWKLIRELIFGDKDSLENVELYDVANDREELRNVALERSDILNDLRKKLDKWSEKVREGRD